MILKSFMLTCLVNEHGLVAKTSQPTMAAASQFLFDGQLCLTNRVSMMSKTTKNDGYGMEERLHMDDLLHWLGSCCGTDR